tara:strand:+ start:1109 stop:1501 length:393 start_codon:yes stop_codon:yes gene_type:complete
LGPTVYRTRPDIKETWNRKEPVEVSQEWLNTHRTAICTNPTAFLVEGDEKTAITVDAKNDGIPDSGWTKKDISTWLTERDVSYSGYTTKAKLLTMVEETLKPMVDEPVAVPEPVEEPVEAEQPTITGDEE